MYNIKEIETIASKKTGISSMQIKDILKLLVDDGLVNCEKCGISNIYWSFKYTSIMKISNDYERSIKRKDELTKSIENGKKEIEGLQNDRKLSVEKRTELNNEIISLINEKNYLNQKINKLLENSPEKINQRLNKIQKFQDSIDIMMDNIEILINFLINSNPNLSKDEIYEYFKIPQDI